MQPVSRAGGAARGGAGGAGRGRGPDGLSGAPALVVKLGGSHADSPDLRGWLDAMATAAGRVVLVPGGGPFADAVRDLQPRLGFDDATAHAMALLAMAQYGLFLAARAPILAPAESDAEIAAALAAGRIPLWLPPRALGPADGITASWDVTSDSLALWLAIRLRTPSLLLVKRTTGGAALVDPAFAAMRADYAGRVFVAGPAHLPRGGLDANDPPGLSLR